jgi:hypothetical protein
VKEADARSAAIRREEKRSRSCSRTDSIRCELWPSLPSLQLRPAPDAEAALDGKRADR